MKPLISIIVPVYNAENTLSRCIDSIINQNFKDWELLLINDGSIDSSGHICDCYSNADSRIKVFHKKNGGVSSARNIGINNAKGEWITFVDSDDWIAQDALSIDFFNINDDLLIFSYYSCINGSISPHTMSKCIIKDKKKIDLFCEKYLINAILRAPWSKIFKKEKIGNTRFDEKIIIGEDTLFVLDFLKNIHSCRVIEKYFYIYNECNIPLYLKYKLSIEESVYAIDKLFQSYDELGIVNEQVEKYIFLDYKLYCYDDICNRPDFWFKNAIVKASYNRVKNILGFNFRFRYFLLSNKYFFKLNRLLKKYINDNSFLYTLF